MIYISPPLPRKVPYHPLSTLILNYISEVRFMFTDSTVIDKPWKYISLWTVSRLVMAVLDFTKSILIHSCNDRAFSNRVAHQLMTLSLYLPHFQINTCLPMHSSGGMLQVRLYGTCLFPENTTCANRLPP